MALVNARREHYLEPRKKPIVEGISQFGIKAVNPKEYLQIIGEI